MTTTDEPGAARQDGSPSVDAASVRSLADVMIVSRTAGSTADAQAAPAVHHAIDAPAWQRACELARQEGWLADTPWFAALALCEASWRGAGESSIVDAASPASGSPAAITVPCAPETFARTPAREWLGRVDALRRDAASARTGDRHVHEATQPSDDATARLRWCGSDAAAANASSEQVAWIDVGIVPHEDGSASLHMRSTHPGLAADAAHRALEALAHAALELTGEDKPLLSTIRTVAPSDLQRQSTQWNRPLAPVDPSRSIVSVFGQVAAAHRDRVALRAGDGDGGGGGGGRTMTYGALDTASDRVAAHLGAAGVRPGDVVCVSLDRGIDSIVVVLGLLKAGAAYLPVDPRYPSQRLAYMLDDAHATLVLTSREHAAAFGAAGAGKRVLDVARLLDEPDAGRSAPTVSPQGRDLAYVMYTSGSTGEPKGIEITHANVLRLVIAASFVPLEARTVMLHAAPLGFDASTLELWGALLNGGCCVPHDEEVPTAAGLRRTLQAHGVNTAWLTAALFNAVVDSDVCALAGLEHLLIGGEALSVPHVRRALDALPATTIHNGYGPTECTTFAATYAIPRDLDAQAGSVPIGRAINDTTLWVLSPRRTLLPCGLVGELYIGGHGLARGYLNRPALTAEKFVDNPFEPGQRLYRTGDLVRWREDGALEFVGRIDGQVKIRGFRIELGEIEAALAAQASVNACAVVALPRPAGGARLVAYLVARNASPSARAGDAALKQALETRLPSFMVPSAFVWLDALPVTRNGKLDRRALPDPTHERPALAQPYLEPVTASQRMVCDAFAQALDIDRVGRLDNFFDLGGNSLLVLRVLSQLHAATGKELSPNVFFRQPVPERIAAALDGHAGSELVDDRRLSRETAPSQRGDGRTVEPIAIVGMAGRFPGAGTVEQFWDNLLAGRDGIRHFREDELDPSLPAGLVSDPQYVKARGVLDGVDLFDAAFFGISPAEATLMDPQQRVFLELCWECLERAGHRPDAAEVPVGVFAGMYNATYFQRHVSRHPELVEKLGDFQVMLANEKDYIATRVANRLNLTGPAVSVHTACSTSLVAIAQAVSALRASQCDMALAGGSSITCPPSSGYLYQEGSMLSPDGRTRSFDQHAQGTVFSDGAAVVLLKRLSDAIADGDTVHALITGVAVNNDGREKASFTAPSVDGQAAVIAAAHASAGVDPRSISYVEAHGTATPMGDPVEVEALTRAFRRGTSDRGFCRLGSVKSNVGHLVIAAGATGVIKTALSLREETLPATIHFSAPNPKIDFDASPFIVNDRLTPWPRGQAPRRAGVSGFGVGGTNAHVVMEEPPLAQPSPAAQGPQVLVLSARTPGSLDAMAHALAAHLESNPQINLADAAHTLQHGRSRFAERLAIAADTPAEAAQALRDAASPWRARAAVGASLPRVVWMFPGQGSQYAGMGSGLHLHDAAFRAALDEALAACGAVTDLDLRSRLFGSDAEALRDTAVTQPATFCIEYALAQAWMARGLRPDALVGHSVGEFAAAVIAGVMSLEDAARLVCRRGAMMQALPPGSMMSVRLSADEVARRMPATLSLAAENAPGTCVVAGPSEAVEQWRATLEAEGAGVRILQTSHAFHSSMMDPAVEPFGELVRQVRLRAPRLAIVSTLTGLPLTDEQATDPAYWARHLREPVRFSAAIGSLLHAGHCVFLEVGPRAALAGFVRQQVAALRGAGFKGQAAVAQSLGDQAASESRQMALALGQLWACGIELGVPMANPSRGRRRIVLPTYAFDRKRFWLDAGTAASSAAPSAHPSVPAMATPVVAVAPAPQSQARPVMPTQTMTMPSAPATPARPARLATELRSLFEDVGGLDLSSADPQSSFVELGLDSLTLTQAALQVKKRYAVNVTFRQLMEDFRSLDSLAAHLDRTLPPEAAAPAPQAPATPASAAAHQVSHQVAPGAAPVGTMAVTMPAMPSADASALQQLIAQQMQLMSQQLALLGAQPPAMPPQAAAAAAQVQPAAAAVALPPAVSPLPAPVAFAEPARAAAAEAAPEAARVQYDVKKAFGAIARIHTQSGDLTERQRTRLDALATRYVERTRKSKEYTRAHRPHLADPRVVNGFRPMTKEMTYQIVIERSKGSRLWDLDGNEYVDVLNGFGMSLFGWQPDFVMEAVRRQLDAGYEIGPQHPLAGEVADLICELTGFDRAGLCNTGSEAVMAAIRIARTVTGRDMVVMFSGSYHGTFDEVVVRAGRGGKGIPGAPGILPGAYGDVRVLDYGTPQSMEFIRENAEQIAAVLVEPVHSRRPDFQPKEFLRDLRELTRKSGTCLIFDEVITGFRSHPGGVQALFGIKADLATYGKVIGGGMPIGVIAGVREFMDALDGGAWEYGDASIPTVGVTYFAGTFVRHPLALAAAKASLVHLKERGGALQQELNLHTAALADELTAFCREAGAPIEVRYFSSLWRVSWLEDHPMQDLLFAMMRTRGVHILDNFPCFLTTAHTPEDIAIIKRAFKESVAELQEAEFLPRRATLAVVADASRPPVPNARLGRDKDGRPAWFVPDPAAPGKFTRIDQGITS